MTRLKHPDLWFLIALLLLGAGGAVLLGRSGAVRPESSELSYARHYWQVTFDSLSAACGVGLLTYDIEEDYTAQGRWFLTAVGVLGALLFIAAVTHALRRGRTSDTRARVPHPLLTMLTFVVAQALLLGILLLATRIGGSATSTSETAWGAIAAFSSLGWAGEGQPGAAAWPLALLAWLGALGWPMWLLLLPRYRRRLRLRSALAMLGSYTAILLLAGLLITALESPRGGGASQSFARPGSPPNTALSAQPWPTRYARSLVQTVAASGAGIPTESFAGRDVSGGTKGTLAMLLLVGGLGGSATGGIQWPLLLWALAGSAAAIGCFSGRRPLDPDLRRWTHAGLACLFLLALLAIVVALGLLLIENWTASRFQPPPSFADALLDACSVVGGGNLSSGLTEAVTGRSLIGGIRQSASVYQYGMVWLLLAMVAGRVLPLIVLRRLAEGRAGSLPGSIRPAPPADNT